MRADAVSRYARLLRVMAHPTRLMILAELVESETDVNDIQDLLGDEQAFFASGVRRLKRVGAEKLHAMVVLVMGNSRMRDFYDVHLLARRFSFEGPILVEAIRATFDRRRTPPPASDADRPQPRIRGRRGQGEAVERLPKAHATRRRGWRSTPPHRSTARVPLASAIRGDRL